MRLCVRFVKMADLWLYTVTVEQLRKAVRELLLSIHWQEILFFPCCHLSAEMPRYYLMPIRRDRQRRLIVNGCVVRRMQWRAADGLGTWPTTDRPPYFNLLQWPSGDPERWQRSSAFAFCIKIYFTVWYRNRRQTKRNMIWVCILGYSVQLPSYFRRYTCSWNVFRFANWMTLRHDKPKLMKYSVLISCS